MPKKIPEGLRPLYSQLKELRGQGLRAAEIGKQIGKTGTAVNRLCHKLGIPGQMGRRPGDRSKTSLQLDEKIIKLSAKTVDVAALARKLGITRQAVHGRVMRLRREGRLEALVHAG